MNYYPHHIGDFNSATRHLTRLERGIYRDMLDLYYEKEQPLPADKRMLFRRLLVVAPDEVEAAEQVLADFFVLTELGWFNERCANEIEAYKENQRNANAGGRKKAWIAVGQRIREDIEASDIAGAERRLSDFVRQYGETPESAAQRELLTSLKHPPPTGFDFAGFGAATPGAGVLAEPLANRDATEVQPRCNRGSTAMQPGLLIAEPNQNQNQNQNQNHGTPLAQPTLSEEVRRGAVALSIEFRKHGVATQPADPRLLSMAQQGIDVAAVDAACAEAKRSKPGSLNLGYVKSILERWSREAGSMNVAGARQQQGGRTSGRADARRAVIAELTGESTNGTAHQIIDITPPAAAHQLG